MQSGLSTIVNLALSGNWKTIERSVVEFEMSSNVKDEICAPTEIQRETMIICDNIDRIRPSNFKWEIFQKEAENEKQLCYLVERYKDAKEIVWERKIIFKRPLEQ